jgi:3-hydroxybutyryl-CoA dehydratase
MITFNKGHTFKLIKKFSQQEVLLFSDLCGDKNPIHYDREFCKTTIFKQPIVFGMLGASLFGNLIGNNINGSIYIKQSLSFLKPVYVDEEIEATVQIEDLIKPKNYLKLITQVKKVDSAEIAINGEAVVKFPMDKYIINI